MPKTLKWGQEYSVLLDVGALTDQFILGGYTTTTTRTNLVTNPNFETNTTNWSAVQAGTTLTRITTDDYIGTASLQIDVSGLVANARAQTSTTNRIPVTAGLAYMISAWVKVPTGQPSVSLRIRTAEYTGAGVNQQSQISAATVVSDTDSWVRLSFADTPISGTETMLIGIEISNAPGSARQWLLDAVLFEQSSSLLPYFDGTYADTYTGYTLTTQSWTGTADASTSTATYGLNTSIYGSTLDGTDTLDGSTDFVDATEYILAVAIQRGRGAQTEQFQPGTCRILADDRASGRLFDPANTASTWYEGDFDLAPRRAIKVLAGTAELFVGAITDLDITYEMPNLSFASIIAADGLYELSRTSLTAFTPSSQLTSARVTAILDRAEVAYSTALRDIATGVATCGTVAYPDNTNTLTALQAVAVAEDGRLFANRRNQIVFDPRIDFTFSTTIASFGGTATNEIPILSIGVAYGQETLFNRVQVDVEGGTAAQVAADSTSQGKYGVQTLSFSNVPLNDLAAGSALAQNLLDKYKEPIIRFNEISTSLNACGSALWPTVLALDVGDIINVTKTYTTGLPLTRTDSVFIESVNHDITTSDHRIRFGLGQAQLLTAFILDQDQLDDVDVGLA
jgi:hypothetical protein